MSSQENIKNAFEVVRKTYENINKLMEYCKTTAVERDEFCLMSPKFLCTRSNVDYTGWCINSFVLLFQKETDKLLENGWRDGDVYVMEINLESHNVSDEYEDLGPLISVNKFSYKNIAEWSQGILPSSHWAFHEPLYDYDESIAYEVDDADDCYYDGKVCYDNKEDSWWNGLTRVVGKEIPLTEINETNAYEQIFGTFKELDEKYK